jgi:hypothetical protein
MAQQERQESRIPDFASHEEEAAFWDTHDITDYLDEFKVVDRRDVLVEDNLSTGITVRLTPALLRQLRTRAKRKGVGPSTLARMWILEHLRETEGNERQRTP